MLKNTLNSPKIHAIAYFFAFGLSVNSYAIEQSCIDRHEICPKEFKKTTYAPTYHELLKKKPSVSAVPAPVVPVKSVIIDDDNDTVVNTSDKCPGTPNGYKVDKDGCPKSVTLHINFPFASNTIPSSSENDIQALTTFLEENPLSTVSIIGHTDNIGTDSRNQPLSEARAKALSDKLIQNNIEPSRIKISGKGSKSPIATNYTDSGRAQNRRIEVLIK